MCSNCGVEGEMLMMRRRRRKSGKMVMMMMMWRRIRTIFTSRAAATTTRSRSVFLMVASTRVGVGGGHPGGHGRAHLIIGLVCSRG